MWEPGSTHGYHAITCGWLVGEVVRRISGKSLGTFFADEVADPLGLDFCIGLPAREESRVSRLIEVSLEDPDLEPIGERARAMLEAATTPRSHLTQEQTTTPLDMSAREFRAAELPAANGVTDARSPARMYASLIGDGDGAVDDASRPTKLGPGQPCSATISFSRVMFLASTWLCCSRSDRTSGEPIPCSRTASWSSMRPD